MKCVNYEQNGAVKPCIFKELCNEKSFEFEVFWFYSNVRWLSRGKVLNRVFDVYVNLALFLREHQDCGGECGFVNSEFILT